MTLGIDRYVLKKTGWLFFICGRLCLSYLGFFQKLKIVYKIGFARVSIQGVKSLWVVGGFIRNWAPGTLTGGA